MCTVYWEFSQYRLINRVPNSSSIGNISMVIERKQIISPELKTLKMLSPFSIIKKIIPIIKNTVEFKEVLLLPLKKEEETKQLYKPLIYIKNSKQSMKLTKILRSEPKRNWQKLDGMKKTIIKPIIKNNQCIKSMSRHCSDNKLLSESKIVSICSFCGELQNIKDISCKKCFEKLNKVSIKGYLYEKSEGTNFNKFWYILVGTQLYKFNSEKEMGIINVCSLLGCIINQGEVEFSSNKIKAYPIIICLERKKQIIYAVKKDDQEQWFKSLRNAIGYFEITDFYELGMQFGNGRYGVIRTAVNKVTHESVAVKLIKKEKVTENDLVTVRREIEVMRICQHPNIVSIIDTFENSDYIYIVLELLKGEDLFFYLSKRNFEIKENRARSLIHLITTALYYIHSYGIIHRDIKLENILMTNSSDFGEPKLIDFGFSKMIGPNEYCSEPFGTLGYAAPEVLSGKPYDKRADVWSLGVVLFMILAGCAPFDGESDKERAQYYLIK